MVQIVGNISTQSLYLSLLGKVTQASGSTRGPERLVDENIMTSWLSYTDKTSWAKIDLGKKYMVAIIYIDAYYSVPNNMKPVTLYVGLTNQENEGKICRDNIDMTVEQIKEFTCTTGLLLGRWVILVRKSPTPKNTIIRDISVYGMA